MELITTTQIYWLTRLDNLQALFIVFLVISTLLSTVLVTFYLVYKSEHDHDAAHNLLGGARISVSVVLLSLLGVVFVPTTKEACAIYVVPKVVNNPQIQYIGTNTLGIAEAGIKYLRELV